MMKRIAILSLTLIFFEFLCGRAFCEEIRIRTGFSVDSSNPVQEIRVLSVNDGPGNVYNLNVSMETPWKHSQTLFRPVLSVNEENRVLFSVKPEGIKKGRYPLIVTHSFRDRNGLQMMVQDVSTLQVDYNGKPVVSVSSGGVEMELGADLDFTLRSECEKEVKAAVRLVYPPSIAVENNSLSIRIEPMSSARVVFRVRNRYAKPCGVIPVYAVAEYDQKGIHETAFVKTAVKVAENHNQSKPLRIILWIILFVTGGFACYFYVIESRERKIRSSADG